MGSSRPSMQYNAVRGRWELRGKSGKLVKTFTDDSQVMGKTLFKVGSNAAVAVGTGNMAIASIAVVGVKEGDFVSAVPKTAILGSIGIGGFFVSGDDNINVYAINPMQTNGTFSARGWDVLVIRSDS